MKTEECDGETLTPEQLDLRDERIRAMKTLFPLGIIYITSRARKVLDARPTPIAFTFLAMHRCGVWGDVDRHDWEVNETSLRRGQRLLSVYDQAKTGLASTLWLITEADRSMTTILLPEEY